MATSSSQGATALTEAWDANPSDSQDHFMLGHITEWFYHDLAGIQYDPALPGFQHVIIKPALVGGITWVNASYNSVRGPIGSAWTADQQPATFNVTIPVGSTGFGLSAGSGQPDDEFGRQRKRHNHLAEGRRGRQLRPA